MTDSVPELAAEISPDDAPPAMSMRVGVVTAVEVGGSRRLQVDIASDTWLNRLQDTQIQLGDRVSILQQGPVMLIIGRLEGNDAFTPVGSVLPYAGSSAPMNWLLCDGSAVSRTIYADLFVVCGTAYGVGNGTTTFNIPNMSNRLPMGAGGTYTRASTGTGSVTLATGNMPSHNHTLSSSSDSAGSHGHSLSGSVGSGGGHSHSYTNASSTRGDMLASGGSTCNNGSFGSSTSSDGDHSHSMSGSADSGGGHTHSLSGSTGSNGSGTAFTTTGPYVALQYIIRAT